MVGIAPAHKGFQHPAPAVGNSPRPQKAVTDCLDWGGILQAIDLSIDGLLSEHPRDPS